MASASRTAANRTEGPGWLATLAGAALLVVAGFGVGLVAGTAFEEPDLVMAHLAGNTTEVALGAPPAGVPPAPAAADDSYAVAADSAPPPAVAAAPPPPSRSGGFAIQVGAFSTDTPARELAAELSRLGMPTYVANEPGGARFKVRVGPIATREEATQLARRLKTEHRLPTWVLSRER
jgi:cell division septation protein DedD